MNATIERSSSVTTDREIATTRIFDAPRELVFQAWTDPARIARWWGPRGFTTSTYAMDVRPGGVWRFCMHGPDGVDYENQITYVEVEEPGPEDLYDVGVSGTVARMLKVPDGTLRILVQGASRVRIVEYVATEPYLIARIEEEPDIVEPSPELEALKRNVQMTFGQIVEQVPYLPEELQIAVANIEDPAELGHMIAGALRISTEEKQELLGERDLAKRLRRLSELLARESELISIGTSRWDSVWTGVDPVATTRVAES